MTNMRHLSEQIQEKAAYSLIVREERGTLLQSWHAIKVKARRRFLIRRSRSSEPVKITVLFTHVYVHTKVV